MRWLIMAVSAIARATHSLRRVLFPDLETLIPPERLLFRFDRPESLAAWQCATDRDVGGKTDARLTHLEDFARFEGALSKEKTGNMKDSGYAMIRSRPKRRQFNKNFFTSPLFNLSDYDGLLLNLRGDGRMYFLNIQCDGLMPDDLFQTFLPTKAGVWETVAVRAHAHVRDYPRAPLMPSFALFLCRSATGSLP